MFNNQQTYIHCSIICYLHNSNRNSFNLFLAPEVLAQEPAFPQSDIWTVGVLTYVMLSGTVPFRGDDENESRQNILFVRYRFENLFQEVTQEATRFLMLLFKRHPK